MAWYDPSKFTTSKIRISVRKLSWSPNMTNRSMFPRGYALMLGTIPRKGKREVRSLDCEMPMASRVSTYKMFRLLPPSISTLVRRLLLMMASTTSGKLPGRGMLGAWSPRSKVIGVLDQWRNFGMAFLAAQTSRRWTLC
jgi:hypothetical protein